MDIFSVLNLVGGLALFLYGMNLLGDSLEKLSVVNWKVSWKN